MVRLINVYGLNDQNKIYFEEVVKYCAIYAEKFPLSFVLGFFVSTVMTRWWTQFTVIKKLPVDSIQALIINNKN
jgi:hypothetical protein